MTAAQLLRVRALSKTYRRGRTDVAALQGVTFELAAGGTVAIMGPSGSGKTTLLNLMAGFDRPDGGEVLVCGQRLADLTGEAVTIFRRRHVGFVFQFFNLLPTMTAWDNVSLPLLAERLGRREIEGRTTEALDMVRMRDRATHRPDELSGGEQQRVAIARALVMKPPLVLADEPTGNLDSTTAQEVLALFREVVSERGAGLVLVTHSRPAAGAMDRVLVMQDGRIVERGRQIDTAAGRRPDCPAVGERPVRRNARQPEDQ